MVGVLAAILALPALPVEPVPDEAYAVEEFVRTHNYSPPPGLKGGRPYRDDNHALPALLRPYKEYDVHPPQPGGGGASPRVVLSDRIPYASGYSATHYDQFILVFPPGCLVDPTRWVPGAPGGVR